MKAAASAGTGPAVLSEGLAVAVEVATGQLVVVPVDLDLTRSLRAVWLPERRPDGPAADLVRLARD